MSRHRSGSTHRSDEGAALVEFALVLPLFAMLIVGLFSSAVLYDGRMQLTHAAREGARYGATVPADQTFTGGGTWANNIRALVLQREGGRIGDGEVCVALVEGSPAVPVSSSHTTTGGVCYDDSASGEDGQRVQIRVERTMMFEAVVFSREITTVATASSRHESRG